MLRITSIFMLLLLVSTALPAQQSKKPAPNTTKTDKSSPVSPTAKASPSLLNPRDSIFLTVEKGQKIIQHPVKPRQTLFSVAKFYGLSLEELYEFNPIFQQDPVLHIGQKIRIPVPNIAIQRYKTKDFVWAKNASIYYIVQPSDNLYQISKRYFNMPVDSVVKRNRMKTNTIEPGQRIHMGWLTTEGIPLEWRKNSKPTAHDVLRDRYSEQRPKYKEVNSQGICSWNQDSREKGDLYALHREAAIGTVVAVTNPANKNTVFAKVIGRIPPNYENSVEVVLSPAAARRVGATKPEFMSRLKFLK